jgi:hypothetical protein
MARIRAQSQTEAELAVRVLRWVTFAQHPLKIDTLQQAVVVEPGDTELDWEAITIDSILVSVCAGLVLVDRPRVVRPIRKLYRDFPGHGNYSTNLGCV